MKVVRVVAAVICDDIQTKHKIYATARGYGDYKGQWEFPGGKIEPGETAQQALKREIEEELDTEIAVHDKIGTIEYDYPAFHLSMDCFWCEVLSGDLVLKEAEAARWLTKDELDSVQWLPADQTILEKNPGDDEITLLLQVASASSASVYTKAQTRMALQICRAYSACWDAVPIPVNITEP